MAEFHIALPSFSLGHGKTYFTQNFAGLQRGGQQIDEELVRFDYAFAFGPIYYYLCVQRENRGWPIGSGIGVRQASSDGAFIADLNVAQVRRCFGQQWANAAKQVRRLNLIVRGHRTNANLSAFFADVRQDFKLADVNQHAWLHQAQLHGWNQAVTTRQELGVVFMFGQELQSFVEVFGGDVIELCWNHDRPLMRPLLISYSCR